MKGMSGVVEDPRKLSTRAVVAELARRAGIGGKIVPRRGVSAEAVVFVPGSRRPYDALGIAIDVIGLPYADAVRLVADLHAQLEGDGGAGR